MKGTLLIVTAITVFLALFFFMASVMHGSSLAQVATPTATPRPAEGGTIALGQSVTGVISIGRVDFWSFTGTTGQLVIITLETSSGNLDPYLELLDPTGLKESSDLDTGPGVNARITKRLAKSGVYTIKAMDIQARTSGAYTLRLTDPAHIPSLPFGGSINGAVETPGFSALYTFPGTSSQNVIITMDAAPGSTLDPYLELLNPDGALEASGTPSSSAVNESIAKTLNNTGAYIVVAGDWWGTSTGAYAIGIISPTGATPTPVATATPAASPTPAATPTATPGPATVAAALSSIEGKYTAVWNFDAATGAWKFYNVANPAGATIAKLDRWKAYWINMTEDAMLIVESDIVPLYKGWNMVGWAR